jgi:hypothetical protein
MSKLRSILHFLTYCEFRLAQGSHKEQNRSQPLSTATERDEPDLFIFPFKQPKMPPPPPQQHGGQGPSVWQKCTLLKHP